MEIKVITSHSEYDSFKSLLRIAILKFETYEDCYIRIVVENAQKIVRKPSYKNSISSDFYLYSTALAKMQRDELLKFDCNHLGREEFVKLLDFFEKL